MSKVSFGDSDAGYTDTATKLVNEAINDAITQLEKTFAEEFGFTLSSNAKDVKDKVQELSEQQLVDVDRSKTPLLIDSDQPIKDISNIEWMTIDKFGKEVAESKIDEFIKSVSVTPVLQAFV